LRHAKRYSQRRNAPIAGDKTKSYMFFLQDTTTRQINRVHQGLYEDYYFKRQYGEEDKTLL